MDISRTWESRVLEGVSKLAKDGVGYYELK
jgi:hypothetical protein